jgi:hypothetical protein
MQRGIVCHRHLEVAMLRSGFPAVRYLAGELARRASTEGRILLTRRLSGRYSNQDLGLPAMSKTQFELKIAGEGVSPKAVRAKDLADSSSWRLLTCRRLS